MRWLGPSLVVVALVFSTGGVAIVGHADSASDRELAQSQCPAKVAPRRTTGVTPPAPVAPAPPRPNPDNKSIVLNTSGYNYPLEGQWHPDPVAQPEGVPEGVLPETTESTPAAPAAK